MRGCRHADERDAVTAATAAEVLRSPRKLLSIRRSLRDETWPVVSTVSLAGLVVLGIALSHGVAPLAGPAVALLVAATLAEAFPVPIERVAAGATSFANVFIAAAAVLYGWRAAVLVGAGAMLLVELRLRRPATRLVYNSALYVLGGAAAGLVATVVPDGAGLGLGSSLGFYAVNIALLGAVVSQARHEPYLRVASSFYRSTLVPFAVMAATTAILIQLWQNSPYYTLLLAAPIVLIVGYQRSLTEALRRQRELDELKDEFIAVISHELRTPLASVLGSAITLERRELDTPTKEQLIGIIRRESARLAKLVEDVLWVSRLDANRKSAEDVSCDAAAVLHDVGALASAMAPDEITISVKTDPASIPLPVEAEQFRRVVANLVDNAIKYSPDGGTVEATAKRVDDVLLVTVSDEGIGVPPAERHRIFEKFTRLDPQMRRGIAGTGLGLYICRELVRKMGGRIWVVGNQGRGSTFGFEIPVETAEGEA
jgi:signal transduction histidine kinase